MKRLLMSQKQRKRVMKATTNLEIVDRAGCDKCNPINSIDDDYLLMDDSTLANSYGNERNYLDVTFKDNMLYADAELYADRSLHAKTKIRFCPFCGTSLEKVEKWKRKYKNEKNQ